MKKTLLIGTLIFNACFLQAQVLELEDFDLLPIGNISTDLTGSTAGVGNWFTYVATGAVTDFQIVSVDAGHGNSAQIIGTSGTSGIRYLWKSDLSNNWPTRTSGNDILTGTLQIYTGNATGGAATARSYIYENNPIVGVGYDYATTSTKIKGYAYGTDTSGTGVYSFTLGANTYPANTWITVGYTFNKVTGAVSWTTPEGTFSPGTTFTPGSIGLDPNEQDFLSTVGAGNNIAHITAFDNYKLEAKSSLNLSTKEAIIDQMSMLRIYPNPSSDFVNVETKSTVKKIKVYDISGKLVNSKLKSKQLDIRNLNKGSYIIVVETENGIQSQKFIKK